MVPRVLQRSAPLFLRAKAAFPAIAFFGGFLWDAATLGRSIQTLDLFILLGYQVAAGGILIWMGRRGSMRGGLAPAPSAVPGPSSPVPGAPLPGQGSSITGQVASPYSEVAPWSAAGSVPGFQATPALEKSRPPLAESSNGFGPTGPPSRCNSCSEAFSAR